MSEEQEREGTSIWFPSMTPDAPKPEWVIRQQEMLRLRREANNFCSQVTAAAELVKASKELSELALRTSSHVSQSTMFTNLPFKIEVHLEEGTEAFIVHDDDVIDSQPASFIADEVRSIGVHGVEFYNRENDTWLKTQGFDFELNPVFPEDTVTEA